MKFTIVIPLYNKAATVGRTIGSVLRQSCGDFEVVVVDDGSTDGGAGVVESIADGRVRLIRQANRGVSVARNSGLAAAQGEFVTFLDADDEYAIGYLSELERLIQTYPGYNVYATSYKIRTGGHEKFPKIRGLRFTESRAEGEGVLQSFFKVMSSCHAPVHVGSIVVRRSGMNGVNFPVGIKSGQDLFFIAHLMTANQMVLSLKPLYIYNFEETNRVFRKHEKVDSLFDGLLREPTIDPYLRSYVALWHTRRAVYALRTHDYGTIFYHLLRSLSIKPMQTKVFTAMAAALVR